jgi:hypothetical protein
MITKRTGMAPGYCPLSCDPAKSLQTWVMARRVALLLVALALVLAACGGDDDAKDASKKATTTSAGPTSSTTASTATLPPISKTIVTPHALAAIAVQIDNPLRQNVDLADACIHGRPDECIGRALGSYKTLDDLGGAVSILADSVTKGNRLYIGDLPDDLTALYDSTIGAGADVKDKSIEAQRVCLPQPTDGCDAANKKLDDALIQLYKQFNAWRDLL